MRSIKAILNGRKPDKKQEKLMEINKHLFADITDYSKATQKQNIAISALVETLTTIVKGTRFEGEVNDILDTCEKHLYKD